MSNTSGNSQGQYVVVATSTLGRLGYRGFGQQGKLRIRMEPSGFEACNKLRPGFDSNVWAQPDGVQMRFATTVDDEPALQQSLSIAVKAILSAEGDIEVGGEAPDWMQPLIQRCRSELAG